MTVVKRDAVFKMRAAIHQKTDLLHSYPQGLMVIWRLSAGAFNENQPALCADAGQRAIRDVPTTGDVVYVRDGRRYSSPKHESTCHLSGRPKQSAGGVSYREAISKIGFPGDYPIYRFE